MTGLPHDAHPHVARRPAWEAALGSAKRQASRQALSQFSIVLDAAARRNPPSKRPCQLEMRPELVPQTEIDRP